MEKEKLIAKINNKIKMKKIGALIVKMIEIKFR
jgi:hypothetical protein